MNRIDHLLVIAGEEGAEVTQRASKALRFGLEEVQPGQSKNNAQRLVEEYADLAAVMSMLQAEGLVDLSEVAMLGIGKVIKVEKFLKYSAEQGRLD